MKIIMVCTGNTCRSPMAAALLKDALDKRGVTGVTVESAGIFADRGQPATGNAQAAMREYGLDISRHQSTPLTGGDGRNTLILCMTRAHVESARRLFPGARVMLLSEAAGVGGEVPDPYGGPLDSYLESARALAAMVEAFSDRLAQGHFES